MVCCERDHSEVSEGRSHKHLIERVQGTGSPAVSRIRCGGFHSCQRLRQKQQSVSFLLRFFYQEVYARFSLAAHAAGRCPVGRQLRMLALKSPGSVSGAVHADTPSAACPSTQTFPPRCSCAAAQPGPPRTCPAGLWGRRAVLQTCERGDVSTFPVGPLPPSSRRSGCSSLQLLPQGKYLESSRHSSSQEQVKHWPDNNSKCL